jgi:hypothetical protein
VGTGRPTQIDLQAFADDGPRNEHELTAALNEIPLRVTLVVPLCSYRPVRYPGVGRRGFGGQAC